MLFAEAGVVYMESSTSLSNPSLIPGGWKISKWPWWVIVLVLIGLGIIILITTSPNYQSSFSYLIQGVYTTLRITVFSYLIATIIGLFAGLARVSKNVFLFNLSTLYVEVVRGIPLVVLLLYIAFALFPIFVELVKSLGGRGLGIIPESGFFQALSTFSIRSVSMEGRAIIALGFGYGAYEAEVFRAGIQSIGKGQTEAARSLGMTYLQAMRFIVLPQAIRRVLPPLGNDFIACLKDSSLATVLAVNELTQLGRMLRASNFRVLEVFNIMAFLYLTMTLLLSGAVHWLEKKMKIEE
jgi:polar amino acid transport system permease protein